jgi:hypothetical protein
MPVSRFQMALDIQDAVNPSGVAHAFLDICLILRSQPSFEGTEALKRDPALRLISYKLADMMGNHIVPPVVYTNAYDACKRMAAMVREPNSGEGEV